MHGVAICEVVGPAETVAVEIAKVLGVGTYDARVWLNGVLPRVVMQSADPNEANEVARSLRAHGHGVVVFDLKSVVPGKAMVRVHRFAFDETGLWANGKEGARVLWNEIAAVIVLSRRVDVARRVTEYEPAGVDSAQIVERVSARHEHVHENATYLFLQDRPNPPWLMHERDMQYLALGRRMRLTQRDNFREVVSLVRTWAPGAVYDERYAWQPRTASQVVEVNGFESAVPKMSDAATDLQVHVLAEWLLRDRGGPYR